MSSATIKAEAAANFKAGNFGAAASLYARAISLGGDEPHTLHCNRAAALAAQGHHADAAEAAQAAIALDTTYGACKPQPLAPRVTRPASL